jgi:hypothetical protein
MAESNPELQAKLQELEHELEEGDITTKGSVNPADSAILPFPHSRSRRGVEWRVPAKQR